MKPIEIKNRFKEYYKSTGRTFKGFDLKQLKKAWRGETKKGFYYDLKVYSDTIIKEQMRTIINEDGHFAQYDLNMNMTLGQYEELEDSIYKVFMNELLKDMVEKKEIKRITLNQLKKETNLLKGQYENYSNKCLIILPFNWERKEKIKNLLQENI